jgi:hypothetical protein
MAKKARLPAQSSLTPRPTDGDGNDIHNQILLCLPLKEREQLFWKLEFLRLVGKHLLTAGRPSFELTTIGRGSPHCYSLSSTVLLRNQLAFRCSIRSDYVEL